MAGHGFWICVHCDLDLGDMTLCQGHNTSLRYGQKLCKILSRSNMTVRSYGFLAYVHCDLGEMILGQGHDTLGSWTTTVLNIVQIQQGSEEIWPEHGFLACVHCDLDLRDMTLSQDHDTSMSLPCVMDKNCVKYYPDQERG